MSVLDDPRESKSWRECLRRWRDLAGAAARVRRASTAESFAAWTHVIGERPVLVTRRLLDWDRASNRPGPTLLGPPAPPAAPPPPPVRWWPPSKA